MSVAGRGAVVSLIAVGLAGCFAEDSVERICHVQGRTPAVLAGDDGPTVVTLELACDAELALADWSLHAPAASLGAPSEGAGLTADAPRGRTFALSGTFTPRPYVSLDAIEISATRDDGVRDQILVVDWSVAP